MFANTRTHQKKHMKNKCVTLLFVCFNSCKLMQMLFSSVECVSHQIKLNPTIVSDQTVMVLF